MCSLSLTVKMSLNSCQHSCTLVRKSVGLPSFCLQHFVCGRHQSAKRSEKFGWVSVLRIPIQSAWANENPQRSKSFRFDTFYSVPCPHLVHFCLNFNICSLHNALFANGNPCKPSCASWMLILPTLLIVGSLQ